MHPAWSGWMSMIDSLNIVFSNQSPIVMLELPLWSRQHVDVTIQLKALFCLTAANMSVNCYKNMSDGFHLILLKFYERI